MKPKTPLRVLIVLQYPGYLRYFDSVIEELSRRGHSVTVSFDKLDKQREGLIGLEAIPRVTRIDTISNRHDAFRIVARELRTVIDYVRYKHPDFRSSPYLSERMRDALPRPLRWLGGLSTLSPKTVDRTIRGLLYLEKCIPSSSQIRAAIESVAPDVVLVSPLVTKGSPQVDVVKAAQALGVPCALGVGSWDHLTTKGLVRIVPDRVFVWNELQRAEAVKYHQVEAGRVKVTGAQNFDKWFHWRPGSSADEFRAKVGLPPGKPYVLFVGSTASISAPDAEVEWVTEWLRQMRSQDAPLAKTSVLIRPHPYNLGRWDKVDLSEFANVAVYPRFQANPVASDDRQDYFDSIHHSAAVVGINTSAMIEAAILDKPVHTIRTEEFARTQEGTLHFRYMLPENGGFLNVAADPAEHFEQLASNLKDPETSRAITQRFVRHFLRPLGIHRDATPTFATQLERLGAQQPSPRRDRTIAHPVTAMFALAGFALNALRRLRRG